MAPPRSFAERYAKDRAWRARRARVTRLVAVSVVAALVVGWTLFAVFAVARLKPNTVPPPPIVVDEPSSPSSPSVPAEEETVRRRDPLDVEVDPRTQLEVPRFWRPPLEEEDEEEDLVRGEPTIFVMIASYRDFQCRETVTSALSRASRPWRIRVGVVEQNADDDVKCDEPVEPCAANPSQPLCSFRSQVDVYRMHASKASGPIYARHVGNRMYRGEAFAMQLDAHVQFIKDWDDLIVEQWRATGNDMAVLSTYLTDLQGSIDSAGRSTRKTRPIMCNSNFEGSFPARYLRHGAQPEEVPAIKGSPMLQPFWAAGFSFSRGHFVRKVPYDCCLPQVFMGEEISIGIRAWTFGYDLYATESSVVFHEYAQKSQRRRGVHMFWEQKHGKGESASRSLLRLTSVIKMLPPSDAAIGTGGDDNSIDQTDIHKYGLGSERDVDLFYKLFLVDVQHRRAQPLCKFVKTGVMHRDFSAHLRRNGRGIDYSNLVDYDTKAAIDAELNTNWRPRARRGLTRAIEMNEIGWLRNAIDAADRAEIAASDPALLDRARDALHKLQNKPH